MTRFADLPLIGKWRIVEMELWDADYLDLVQPAFIAFDDQGRGEIAFGALSGALDCAYTKACIDFTWHGSDEMTEINGSGWAEPDDNGGLSGDFSFHLGGETTFKAHRQ